MATSTIHSLRTTQQAVLTAQPVRLSVCGKVYLLNDLPSKLSTLLEIAQKKTGLVLHLFQYFDSENDERIEITSDDDLLYVKTLNDRAGSEPYERSGLAGLSNNSSPPPIRIYCEELPQPSQPSSPTHSPSPSPHNNPEALPLTSHTSPNSPNKSPPPTSLESFLSFMASKCPSPSPSPPSVWPCEECIDDTDKGTNCEGCYGRRVRPLRGMFRVVDTVIEHKIYRHLFQNLKEFAESYFPSTNNYQNSKMSRDDEEPNFFFDEPASINLKRMSSYRMQSEGQMNKANPENDQRTKLGSLKPKPTLLITLPESSTNKLSPSSINLSRKESLEKDKISPEHSATVFYSRNNLSQGQLPFNSSPRSIDPQDPAQLQSLTLNSQSANSGSSSWASRARQNSSLMGLAQLRALKTSEDLRSSSRLLLNQSANANIPVKKFKSVELSYKVVSAQMANFHSIDQASQVDLLITIKNSSSFDWKNCLRFVLSSPVLSEPILTQLERTVGKGESLSQKLSAPKSLLNSSAWLQLKGKEQEEGIKYFSEKFDLTKVLQLGRESG